MISINNNYKKNIMTGVVVVETRQISSVKKKNTNILKIDNNRKHSPVTIRWIILLLVNTKNSEKRNSSFFFSFS